MRTKLFRLHEEHSISFDDALVVTRNEDGKLKLRQAVSTMGVGAAGADGEGAMAVALAHRRFDELQRAARA